MTFVTNDEILVMAIVRDFKVKKKKTYNDLLWSINITQKEMSTEVWRYLLTGTESRKQILSVPLWCLLSDKQNTSPKIHLRTRSIFSLHAYRLHFLQLLRLQELCRFLFFFHRRVLTSEGIYIHRLTRITHTHSQLP